MQNYVKNVYEKFKYQWDKKTHIYVHTYAKSLNKLSRITQAYCNREKQVKCVYTHSLLINYYVKLAELHASYLRGIWIKSISLTPLIFRKYGKSMYRKYIITCSEYVCKT